MPIPKELKPTRKPRLMDLLAQAGVDVSDWKNFSRGAKWAATNPKYCYEWAFIQPKTVVVLCLWYKNLLIENGVVAQRLNLRKLAEVFREKKLKGPGSNRSLVMDSTIQTALRERLPLRVIIVDGKTRDLDIEDAAASKVQLRLLDPMPWAVSEYDETTGDCRLARGVAPTKYIDQFDIPTVFEVPVSTKAVVGTVFSRSVIVRQKVLERAAGLCEFCGCEAFRLADGRLFLETHHIVPLSEKGADSELNVIGLCPTHHKEAHFGARSSQMRTDMLAIVASKIPITTAENSVRLRNLRTDG